MCFFSFPGKITNQVHFSRVFPYQDISFFLWVFTLPPSYHYITFLRISDIFASTFVLTDKLTEHLKMLALKKDLMRPTGEQNRNISSNKIER
jgi:hypothetical protein